MKSNFRKFKNRKWRRFQSGAKHLCQNVVLASWCSMYYFFLIYLLDWSTGQPKLFGNCIYGWTTFCVAPLKSASLSVNESISSLSAWGSAHEYYRGVEGEQEGGGQHTSSVHQAHPPPGVQHLHGYSDLKKFLKGLYLLICSWLCYQNHHHCVGHNVPESTVH